MAAAKAFLSLVLGLAATTSVFAQECLWNSTHCACTQAAAGGSCYRKIPGVSPPACNVEQCAAGGYKCDCLGSDLCKIDSCSTWRPAAADAPVGTKNVPCKLQSTPSCLTKLDIAKPKKMVQMGPKSEDTMWDMKYQTEGADEILKRYTGGKKPKSMHDRWPDKDSIMLRQLNFRLYQSSTVKFVCMIINSWGRDNDGLGNYKAQTTIKGLNGQTLEFMACDDLNECKAPKKGNVLNTKHHGIITHSDGWCVGPLEENGDAISINVSGIENIDGINFLDSDNSQVSYSFESGEGGLSGTVDDKGLVHGGVVPEIIINPSGIEM